MQIDIKTKELKPVRQTYTHIAERLGGDKPASRYQEAVLDVQATENFHYRPTWQPGKELYDPTRTALVMEDWYKFLDPRQYYYGSYCMVRAKQQDTANENFKMAEKRGLIDALPEAVRRSIAEFIVPLRHYEWGANMNNAQICAMGYGAAITSTAMMNAGDRLGNAQYITRIALLLSGNDREIIDRAKADWTDRDIWQGLRRAVEDSLVTEDWFELFVAQNLVMDGLVHPLMFDAFATKLVAEGGSVFTLLSEFIFDWNAETTRWVDRQIEVATGESDANRQRVNGWFETWLDKAAQGLKPLAEAAFGDGGAALNKARDALVARAARNGIGT
jgi:phenol hydroxylase P1 protein